VISDEELALHVQQGRREAWNMLIDRHYQALLNYLYRMSGQQATADDWTQETFVRVWQRITLYVYPRPFRPWLYTIATNLARNALASADQRHTQSADDDADYADTQPLPEDAVVAQDSAQQVLNALARLPQHQREVVVLFYYHEMPQAEIAEVLGIPVGTVKSRLSLGLKRLREMMNE
jgi:RNA polymerase sigma-70 factor (ECF subfamily)